MTEKHPKRRDIVMKSAQQLFKLPSYNNDDVMDVHDEKDPSEQVLTTLLKQQRNYSKYQVLVCKTAYYGKF